MLRTRLTVLIWIAPLLLVAPVVMAGDAFFYGTTVLQFHPWRVLALEALQAGEMPLWNPLSGMGAPLLANYQSALLYPPTWFLFLLGLAGGEQWMAWGQGVLVFAHLALAVWGMARLVRELGLPSFPQVVGGLAFGLSGYLVARAHFLSINAAAAWLPWVLLGAYRLARGGGGQSLLQSSVWMALLLLAGHAQTAWYALLLAGLWFMFWLAYPEASAHSHADSSGLRDEPETGAKTTAQPNRVRRTAAFAGALLLAAGIAAAQLLPTAELLANSQRAHGAGEAFVMTYSFWPWRLLGFLLPGLFGSPVTGDFWGYANYWEDAVYIGLLPFFLAARAVYGGPSTGQRRGLVRFLAAVALVSMLLALGDNTPVFPFLYHHVPSFDLFQAPARWSIWAVFSLALLAAIGAQEWASGVSSYARRRAARWTAVGLAFLLAGAVTTVLLPDIVRSFGRATLVAGTVGAAAAALGLARNRGPRWQLMAAGLVMADLLVAGWGLNPGIDLDLYAPRDAEATAVAQEAGGGRIYLPARDEYDLTFDRYFRFDTFRADRSGLRAAMLPNLNLLDGIPSANNFDPLRIGRYDAWLEALEPAAPDLHGRLLAEMSVSVVATVDPEDGSVRYVPVSARPRAEWLPCAFVVRESFDVALGFVLAEAGPLAIEGPPGTGAILCIQGTETGAAGTAAITSSSFNRITIHSSSTAAGWLLLRDTYYPGWHAQIDGEPVEIGASNAVFRAVPVPAGDHVIEFVYRPASFILGAGLSLASIGAAALLWHRRARIPA